MPESTTSTIQFRDTTIQDMMGKPPGWLLHSGLSAMLAVIVILIGLAAVIPYPEKIEAAFLLQTQTVPLALHEGAGGVVEAILAEDQGEVMSGDTLLVFRSETDWRPVRQLDLWTSTFEQSLAEQVAPAEPGATAEATAEALRSLPPGDRYPTAIQTPVTNLRSIKQAYSSYLITNGVTAEITAYRREITDANRLSGSLVRQVNFYETELGYQQRQNDRMTELESAGIVSTQEAEQAAAQTVSARRQREVLVSSDIQNQLRVQQLRQQILQRNNRHREQLADFDRQLLVQLGQLRSALNAFRDRYVMIAREAGTVSWQPTTREQALASPAELLGYLLPALEDRSIVARADIPATGQGKIAVGDKVVLDFAAYPGREYGQVLGVLDALDPVATVNGQNEYVRRAVITLSDSLTTSYGKTIPFQYNLSGTARFIIAERTFLEQLLEQFLNLTKNT
jgi:hypothetical protein